VIIGVAVTGDNLVSVVFRNTITGTPPGRRHTHLHRARYRVGSIRACFHSEEREREARMYQRY
jgi:hypothetical protein